MACSKLSRSNLSFDFPEDLIIDILSRLPVKSLIRFVVVSKAWYSLIQNPYFISKHLKQSMVNPDLNLSSLLVLSQNENTNEFSMSSYCENSLDKPVGDVSYTGETDCVGIVGVCNGLVCVSLSEHDLVLVIWNPATMKFHEIPDSNFGDHDHIENDEAPIGFGFDPRSNDYKLIKIMRYADEDDEDIEDVEDVEYECVDQAMIYTMSTNSWRVIETDIPFSDDVKTRDHFATATIDGVFYWAGVKGQLCDAVIWSFDMRDKVYSMIEGPKRYQGMWGKLDELIWETFQLKDELAIFVSTSARCYSVWVMNQNKSCWDEKFKIGPFPTIERPVQGDFIRNVNIAEFGKNGDLIIKDYTLWDDVKFFSYNLRSGEIKILPFARTSTKYYFRVFWYTESLLPVKKSD